MIDLPNHADVKEALFQYLLAIDSATPPSEAYWSLAENFDLSDDQLALRRKDGRGSKWENRVQWARRKLVEEGKMDGTFRGMWCLSVDYRQQ